MIVQETLRKSEYDALIEVTKNFKTYFLNDSAESASRYRQIVSDVSEAIITQIKEQKQPYCGKSPAALKNEIDSIDFLPDIGTPLKVILDKTHELVIASNISVYNPHCVAHLHCPPFIASLAAEMIISAFNQSMDSWDQAPVATMIEQALCDKLCKLYGFGPLADATITGGGTMSNFMGMLLARDHYSKKYLQWDIQKAGLPPEASKFRILCSSFAHFTITQSASILGLGQNAIVTIENEGFDEEMGALENQIKKLKKEGLLPIAYVTTAGTTDFGSIGAIGALADCAHQHGLWIHVDAAFGGSLMFSEKHKHKLKGIEKADSVTIDFHKLFYQPISCGLFIVKDKTSFEFLRLHADYLNPESNQDLGILDLVYKSIQTSRRFDALKPFIALQHVGVKKLGAMLDYTIELAEAVSVIIEHDSQFELAYKTPINAVVFRYVPEEATGDKDTDTINNSIKTQLLLSGEAIIGQTCVNERAFLKFTLLNPITEIQEIVVLLNKIKRIGNQLEKQYLKQMKTDKV